MIKYYFLILRKSTLIWKLGLLPWVRQLARGKQGFESGQSEPS